MKTRTLVSILILVLAVMVIAGSCATGKKMVTVDDATKQFAGVYVNTKYSGSNPNEPQKLVITSDGRLENWQVVNDERTLLTAEYSVTESWLDSKGNTYCTVNAKFYMGPVLQGLWKLDKSGNTFEMNFVFSGSGEYPAEGEYPTEIDPNVVPYGPLYYWTGQRQ